MLIHAVADVCEPLAELVRLDEAGVGVVKADKGVAEVVLWVELAETLAHHGEEHGKVDARVCGVCRGGARAGVEELCEGVVVGRDTCWVSVVEGV